jgi:hypothetical protein
LGSIRCGEFFDELRNWQFLKKGPVSLTVGNILMMSTTVRMIYSIIVVPAN